MFDVFSAAVVLVRLFAIYLILQLTFTISALVSQVMRSSGLERAAREAWSALGIGASVELLVAVLLLIFAKSFVGLLVRDLPNTRIDFAEDPETSEPANSNENWVDLPNFMVLQAVGFSLMGAYFLIYAIPMLVRIIALYLFSSHSSFYERSLTGGAPHTGIPLADLSQVLVQIGLGLWLVLGSKGIVTAIMAIWQKGTKSVSGSE